MEKLSLKNAKDTLSRKEMRAVMGGSGGVYGGVYSGGYGTCSDQCYSDGDCSCVKNCYGYSTGMGSQRCGTFICSSANTMQRRCTC